MMEKNKKDKKDTIIKMILVVVIILLLVHNCMLIAKKKAKTPSGNVNIIEITCEDDSKCDITDKKDSINNASDDGSKNNDDTSSDAVNEDNANNNTNVSGNKSNSSKNNSTGGGKTSGNNNSTTSNDDDSTEDDSIVGPNDELFVRDKKLVWNDSSDLDIFTNSVYNFEKIVAPESSNTYQFVVKNSTSYRVKYNIRFSEVNPYSINMKYKLKKNNTYVVDHYVSFNELDISGQLLNAKKNDTFYLDWKWVSSDNDTEAGKNSANYSLRIYVEAESV